MKHLDEDSLLEYALELNDGARREEIARHLESCVDCRARLEQIKADIDVIGSARGKPTMMPPPVVKKSNVVVSLLRVAAILACGIVVGYGAAQLGQTEHICVEPAYLATSPPSSALSGAASDATEVVFENNGSSD